jgi:hypothetical protein
MESEGSLPHAQQPATGPYLDPDEFNSHPPTYFPMIHFNIILPSTPGYSEWSLPFRLSNQSFVLSSYFLVRAKCRTHLILLIVYGEA